MVGVEGLRVGVVVGRSRRELIIDRELRVVGNRDRLRGLVLDNGSAKFDLAVSGRGGQGDVRFLEGGDLGEEGEEYSECSDEDDGAEYEGDDSGLFADVFFLRGELEGGLAVDKIGLLVEEAVVGLEEGRAEVPEKLLVSGELVEVGSHVEPAVLLVLRGVVGYVVAALYFEGFVHLEEVQFQVGELTVEVLLLAGGLVHLYRVVEAEGSARVAQAHFLNEHVDLSLRGP